MIEWISTNRHYLLGWLWIVLIIPGVTIWRESLVFVILLSLYANIEASFGAHHAKKGEGGNDTDTGKDQVTVT